MLTTNEIADTLNVSRALVAKWCRTGKLPAERYGTDYRVSAEDFETFRAAAKVRAETKPTHQGE